MRTRLIGDADRCAPSGVESAEVDFVLHDDKVVFTKYEGPPGVVYRDADVNTAREPARTTTGRLFRYRADSSATAPTLPVPRRLFRYCADAADS
jgi:hypothetical protein